MTAFQREHNLKADGIVGSQTWQLLFPSVGAARPNMEIRKSKRTINEIIIHCSATPEGQDFTVADIRRWHKERGWSDIGYHYVIYRDGSINIGRDIDISGAHCTGHNSHSIGICYIGGLAADGKTPKDTRTEDQKASLANLLMMLRAVYPNARILGHRDTSPDRNHNGKVDPWEWVKSCSVFRCGIRILRTITAVFTSLPCKGIIS